MCGEVVVGYNNYTLREIRGRRREGGRGGGREGGREGEDKWRERGMVERERRNGEEE